ncbi:GTPase Era [Sodalis sp. CWE]|uniref:GTPase Era n=1 Tax=Sodalis sp. CWE TaxID=2803816 RepID=UPI001C7CC3DF|nr:GTPase Era [Sodalis sp. CWE]MBX4181023.1 GTPase Era [Sodalis sp. CWE]
MNDAQVTYCGYVTIIGRPNVGKSTLLNQIMQKKISITSRKPQTTSYPVMGISTIGPYQTIYVDTPGLQFLEKRTINRLMNKIVNSFIIDAALVILVAEETHWTHDEELLIKKLFNIHCPIVLAINKVDNLSDKKKLLPHINFLNQKMLFNDIVPICAKNNINVKNLIKIVQKNLPRGAHRFSNNNVTNLSQRFMVSEVIREKLMRLLGDELPYYTTAKINHFFINNHGHYDIHAFILVEKSNQKKIVIGNKGNKIKLIGIKARKDIESLLKKQVYLSLWVKTKSRRIDNN